MLAFVMGTHYIPTEVSIMLTFVMGTHYIPTEVSIMLAFVMGTHCLVFVMGTYCMTTMYVITWLCSHQCHTCLYVLRDVLVPESLVKIIT